MKLCVKRSNCSDSLFLHSLNVSFELLVRVAGFFGVLPLLTDQQLVFLSRLLHSRCHITQNLGQILEDVEMIFSLDNISAGLAHDDCILASIAE